MNIDKTTISLEKPSLSLIPSYVAALREGFRRGEQPTKTPEQIAAIESDPQSYLDEVNAIPTGTFTAPSGDIFPKVPGENLWLASGDIFIGEFNFRHRLNEFLEQVGGHAGYGIRPSFQGKGLATLGLELLRAKAAKMGIEKMLLTCNPDNHASRKVIEKNGGDYVDTQEDPYQCGPTNRYWVPTFIN